MGLADLQKTSTAKVDSSSFSTVTAVGAATEMQETSAPSNWPSGARVRVAEASKVPSPLGVTSAASTACSTPFKRKVTVAGSG